MGGGVIRKGPHKLWFMHRCLAKQWALSLHLVFQFLTPAESEIEVGISLLESPLHKDSNGAKKRHLKSLDEILISSVTFRCVVVVVDFAAIWGADWIALNACYSFWQVFWSWTIGLCVCVSVFVYKSDRLLPPIYIEHTKRGDPWKFSSL